jgi:type IV pilus assembly protein PilM
MGISFKSIFKPLLTSSNPSVLGVDIGSSSIKVVQLKKQKGKAVLETYGELALGPLGNVEIGQATKLSLDQIIKALRELLVASSVTTIECGMSIPMRSSMVSTISMPEMDSKQMAQMVPIEARKYIPVPTSEVTLDWFQIPELDNSSLDNVNQTREGEEGSQPVKKQEILVVAIHNNVLNNYSSIVSDADLSASFFEVEMFSAVRSVLESTNLNPIMVCDIGASSTKYYVVERGIVRESHLTNKGSQEVTLNIAKTMGVSVEFAEKLKRNYGHNTETQDKEISKIIEIAMTPIVSEAKNVITGYYKKYKKNVSKIELIGGGAMLKDTPEIITKTVGVTTEKADPFNKLETPAFLHDVLERTGLSFAPAIGLALRKLQELE